MTFSRILCPIDFSPGSEQALRVATRMASEANVELVLVHVWSIPPAVLSGMALLPPNLIQDMVEAAQRLLDDAVARTRTAGAKQVTGKLLTGSAKESIVDELADPTFDLCIVGTHGRTGLARVFLGSIAEQVVRHSPCSVLVVRPDGTSIPFTHVLVPTEFTASARHALDVAAQIVTPTGSITVLHVVEAPVAYTGAASLSVAAAIDARAAIALSEEATRIRTATVAHITTRAPVGYPGARILATVDGDPTIDLVVMSSHGRTGLKRAMLGSIAEKVVRHARCPVLVTRTRT